MTTEDGKDFRPVFGPGLTGLANIGNSCYLASVMQVLFSIPAMRERYLVGTENHRRVCLDSPPNCYLCQMGKLAEGLLSGFYSTPSGGDVSRGQDGISPGMFKQIIGKDHPEFSTMRQQDASEFLAHVLSTIEQKEKVTKKDPSSEFRFHMEQKLQCASCKNVRYNDSNYSGFNLTVPAIVLNVKEDGKKEYAPADIFDRLAAYFQTEMREYQCPSDGAGAASVTQRFRTFPQYLTLTMSRFVLGSNWVLEKLGSLSINADVHVNAPELLDLNTFRGQGKLSGEVEFPKDSSSSSKPENFNQESLNALLGMGFPEIRCKRALLKTNNGSADVAMNWLFEHMEDPDIDSPLESSSNSKPEPQPADVAQLMDMGFSREHAVFSLQETVLML